MQGQPVKGHPREPRKSKEVIKNSACGIGGHGQVAILQSRSGVERTGMVCRRIDRKMATADKCSVKYLEPVCDEGGAK